MPIRRADREPAVLTGRFGSSAELQDAVRAISPPAAVACPRPAPLADPEDPSDPVALIVRLFVTTDSFSLLTYE